MSGPDLPDTPPPEVPEEFAAAYREAFNRALEEGRHRAGAHEAGVEAVAEEIEADEDDEEESGEDEAAEPAPQHRRELDPLVAATAGRVTEYRAATPWERLRESRGFVPGVVLLLALVLIGGAYGVGRAFSNQVQTAGGDGPTASASPEAGKADAEKGDGKGSGKKKAAKEKPWQGKVADARLGKIGAKCTMSPGVDAGGNEVGYAVANVKDDDPSTAWRCDGDASGERIVISLPEKTAVGRVGLIPGYAKTDPVDGADRYAENNRVTRVRWTLGGGVQVEQELDGAKDNRKLQTVRVPRTTTGKVVLEILDVTKGPRNTTAISEVSIGRAVG